MEKYVAHQQLAIFINQEREHVIIDRRYIYGIKPYKVYSSGYFSIREIMDRNNYKVFKENLISRSRIVSMPKTLSTVDIYVSNVKPSFKNDSGEYDVIFNDGTDIICSFRGCKNCAKESFDSCYLRKVAISKCSKM